MTVIYAVPIQAHEACGVDVGSICWGSCGKGSVGGIGLGEYGDAIPCTQVECPYLDKQMDKPFGTVPIDPDGTEEREVIIRKIRSVPASPLPPESPR